MAATQGMSCSRGWDVWLQRGWEELCSTAGRSYGAAPPSAALHCLPWMSMGVQRLGGSSLPSTAGTHGSGVVSSPRGCACSGAVTAAGVALPAQQGCHGGCARAGLPFSSPAAKRAHSDHRVRTGIEKRNVETAAKLAVLLSFLD